MARTPSRYPRTISYFTEFIKFASGFAAILALSLIALHVAMAAQ